MENDAEYLSLEVDDADDEAPEPDERDDSGTGAAIALLVALCAFLLAVTFVILRNVLFHA